VAEYASRRSAIPPYGLNHPTCYHTERDKRGEIEHMQKIRPIFLNTAAKVIGNICENPGLVR
jgi:hypothetical protein